MQQRTASGIYTRLIEINVFGMFPNCSRLLNIKYAVKQKPPTNGFVKRFFMVWVKGLEPSAS